MDLVFGKVLIKIRILANGNKIWLMDMVLILFPINQGIKGNGWKD